MQVSLRARAVQLIASQLTSCLLFFLSHTFIHARTLSPSLQVWVHTIQRAIYGEEVQMPAIEEEQDASVVAPHTKPHFYRPFRNLFAFFGPVVFIYICTYLS